MVVTETQLQELKNNGLAPSHLTLEGMITLSNGYLLENETPTQMYSRVAKSAAKQLKKPELENKFYDYIYKGWLCLSTPIASNSGSDRALPISCYSISVPDSILGIFKSSLEIAQMTKHGGGVGFCLSNVRGRGARIRDNGTGEGIVPWVRLLQETFISVSQGSVRRGAGAGYVNIDHLDIEEFIQIRRPTGDANRRCQNIHHGITITDKFMNQVKEGDEKARILWKEILKTRFETGEPYLMFIDSVNHANPECYKKNGLSVETSNICSEITLHTDELHSFVCCLSSLNLAKYDEWKNTDLVETSIWFLDGVMSEFIEKASKLEGFERAVRFATKSRALGLGVLGWHSYLQQNMIPFDSFKANSLNSNIFKNMREKAEKATRDLAKEYGEPEWCKGFNRRNTHLLAVAPTVSNSTISGNMSPSIEPFAANAYTKKSAKGTFLQKNVNLKRLLEEKGQDNEKVWKYIVVNEGSVQELSFLSPEEKAVFLTAREMNQMALIRQAAARQKYIDQSQSLNLFFPSNVEPSYFHKVHIAAWESGIKTLYYCRTGSVLKGDVATRFYDEDCKACEG